MSSLFGDCHQQILNDTLKLFKVLIPHAKLFERFYTEDHRHYHGAKHIINLLRYHNKLSIQTRMTPEQNLFVQTAILWHDIIYDPKRKDNEETSAMMFEYCMPNHFPNKLEVHQTILDTKHLTPPVNTESWSLYMLDLDLYELGDVACCKTNSHLIRKEYSHVPDRDYLQGRLDFFKALIGRGYIYHNPYELQHFDDRQRMAYSNINDEMMALDKALKDYRDGEADAKA